MSQISRTARQNLHGEEYISRLDSRKQVVRVKRLMNLIELPHTAIVLDVGCGTGLLAHLLNGRYDTYFGIDFSEPMIQAARQRTEKAGLPKCNFICGDALDIMDNHPKEFDAIFLLDISEHVPDLEWKAIVDATHKALKTGGKVYLHTPNLDFFAERLKHHGWIKQFPEHISVRNEKDNIRFFEATGFSKITTRTLPHYNILRYLHPLSQLPCIGRYFASRLWLVAEK